MKINHIISIILIALYFLIVCVYGNLFFVKSESITDMYISEDEMVSIAENNEFSDERILVVMKHEYSLVDKVYKIEDFPNLNLKSVDVLSSGAESVIKRQSKDNIIIDSRMYKTILCLTLNDSDKVSVLKAISTLSKRNDIESAEPDIVIRTESTDPNDYYYQAGNQWNLDESTGINIQNAWGFSSGCHSVLVGVIDTGIQSTHPDLLNRINTSLSRDFSLSAPYIPQTIDDNHGHGTYVAGIIGAEGNNEIGITGICQDVQLVSLKIYAQDDECFVSQLIMAIDYATAQNIRVLNNSNGITQLDNGISAYNSIQAALTTYPGVFVSSAGNTNQNNDIYDHFPSNIRLPNVISVGSHDIYNMKSGESNWGENNVDIFAPGADSWSYEITERITTTVPTTMPYSLSEGYTYMSGTSLAAPHVAGVAALLLSIFPDLTGAQIKTAIMNSAKNPIVNGVNPLEGMCVCDGKLDCYGAVKYVLSNYYVQDYALNSGSNNVNIEKTVLQNNDYFNNDNGFYKLNVNCTHEYSFNVTSNYGTIIKLYDASFNELQYTASNITNGIRATAQLLPGTYYLRVSFQNINNYGTIHINICDENHIHSYPPSYTWYSLAQHRKTCSCGSHIAKAHVVDENNVHPGVGLPECIICHGPASVWLGKGYIKVLTHNGSYVTENGVIVLVEADRESFFEKHGIND